MGKLNWGPLQNPQHMSKHQNQCIVLSMPALRQSDNRSACLQRDHVWKSTTENMTQKILLLHLIWASWDLRGAFKFDWNTWKFSHSFLIFLWVRVCVSPK